MALRARLRGIAPSFVNGGVPFLARKCLKGQTLRFLSATVTLSRKYRGRGYAPHARTARTRDPEPPRAGQIQILPVPTRVVEVMI